ncbi:magnesium transporter [Sinobacterium caligoides]|uniref:Magnesium transporter MgtE n=1 Tax=Sinobacterium caligoides TaxID=933926 RepID=A0A3N2E338_9GAMM|nr:magnesium transporter [Sinobacterium caligoides]ROS06119.1 magnesium transporter [Sinobacterium caligoides]
MPQANDQAQTQHHLRTLSDAVDTGALQSIRHLLKSLSSPDIAHLIESSPPRQRAVLWRLLDSEREGNVLQELGDDVQAQFLKGMDTDELIALTDGLEPDDIADILQQLPDRIIQEVLLAMDTQDRQRVEKILPYQEDTAGGLMNTDNISVRADITLDVVLRYLRRLPELPEIFDTIFVVNRNDRFLGQLSISKLLSSDPAMTVREIMATDIEPILASVPDTEVANLFERHDWVSSPVINEDGELLGRITIDDVVDVIRDDADHSLLSMAGLDEDSDTFATVRNTFPQRALWLGLNLLTALFSANVIGLFEQTIEKVVALAVLMPIVASMGGVAGNQTLTIIIRGMALGQIGKSNTYWLFSRELGVAICNGLLWASCAALVASLWFNDIIIGAIIASAMIINLMTAATAGVLIPVALRAMKIDPALAGTMALTTITDAVGFFSFLGLATVFLT